MDDIEGGECGRDLKEKGRGEGVMPGPLLTVPQLICHARALPLCHGRAVGASASLLCGEA